MKNTMSLNGSWRLVGMDEGAGNWASPSALTPAGAEIIMAQVPGEVHVDLLRDGKISDPYSETDLGDVQWVGQKEWWYKRTFEVDEDFLQRRAYLEFDGLDTLATVFLNGEEIGKAENMFIAHRFDVSAVVRFGQNTVAVRFEPVKSDCVRKMRASFGEPGPRLVGAGIWRDVRLTSYEVASIKDVHIETEMEGARANAWVFIEVENHTGEDQKVSASVVVSKGESREKIEVTDWVSPFGGVIEAVIRIEEPEFWWPNGMGEPSLYNCMVGISSESEVQDVTETIFGVRDIRFVESENVLLVNGERIFCKGATWMPADLFASNVTNDRYRELVRLAKDANFNTLRTWGGGVYESPAFYQSCDEMGIMIVQDFMFSGADCPDKLIAEETRQIVKSLRNHPCIVAWCTGEMDNTIKPVLKTLDRTRPLLPSDAISHEELTLSDIERCRREKWNISSALLPIFNNSRPTTSSSLIDYHLHPKAEYYQAKRAFEPVIVSFQQIEDRVQVHVTTDDRLQEIDGKLQIGVMTFDACGLDVQEVPVSVDPNSSAAIWESEPLGSILVDAKKQCLVAMLEVRGEIIARDVYFARPLSEIEFPLPRLLVHREQLSETTHELVISADAYARNLVITNIPAESRPSDNCFDVLPGEQKTATIHNLTVEQANELKLNVGRTP